MRGMMWRSSTELRPIMDQRPRRPRVVLRRGSCGTSYAAMRARIRCVVAPGMSVGTRCVVPDHALVLREQLLILDKSNDRWVVVAGKGGGG